MQRVCRLIASALWLATPLAAQSFTPLSTSAIDIRRALTREKKIRYVLRQLDLTAEQAEHAKGLLESFYGPGATPPQDLVERIRNLYKELDEANKAGDKARVEQLTREIRRAGQEVSREPEFFENLMTVLNESQKRALERARARLQRHPSGGVRPLDVLDVIAELPLSPRQRAFLKAYHQRLRKQANTGLTWDDDRRVRIINAMLQTFERVLTPEQIAWVDYRIQRMRPDLVDQPLVGNPPPKPTKPPSDEMLRHKNKP